MNEQKIENEISSIWDTIKSQERNYFKLKKLSREVEAIAIALNDSQVMDIYYQLQDLESQIDEKIEKLTGAYKELLLIQEAGFERKAGFDFAFCRENIIILKDAQEWAILVDNGIGDFYKHTNYVCKNHNPRSLGDVLYEAERLL